MSQQPSETTQSAAAVTVPHSPKFGFLTKHHSLPVRYAAQAERLVFEDANLALTWLWQFAELLALQVAARVGIVITE